MAHAAGEGLRDALKFALYGGFQSGEPFMVHHQGFDVGFGEFGVVLVGKSVELGVLFLDLRLKEHLQEQGELDERLQPY